MGSLLSSSEGKCPECGRDMRVGQGLTLGTTRTYDIARTHTTCAERLADELNHAEAT